ncbi:MAG TPA: hypothetical protein VJZ00_12685 [Thermoanaerobaculia bacterium]|nr:hypothetical protein [Thermoanaerobaculia bacterium]
MNELLMMEAALFQLRAALEDDPQYLPIRLASNVLGHAVLGAKEHGVNAARVNDIEFALNDLVAAVDDAGAPDAVFGAVAMLQNDAASLRAATALPRELIASIRDLQTKLRTRAKAMERSQYRAEGSEPEPLPHAPEELRMAAIPLARQLAAAGFDTPSLDSLVADPDSVRYHTLNEIVDELDVIAGGS